MLLSDLLILYEQIGSAAAPTGAYTFRGTGNYGIGGTHQLANGKLSKPTQELQDKEEADFKKQMDDELYDPLLDEQQKSSWDARPVRDSENVTVTGSTQLVKNQDHLDGQPINTNTPSVLGGTGALANPKNFVPNDSETEEKDFNLERFIHKTLNKVLKSLKKENYEL